MAESSGLPIVSGATYPTLISGTANVVGNWQVAETNLIIIGAAGINYILHSLAVGIQNTVGAITIRVYELINGVERQVYPVPLATTFTMGVDPAGIWIINGSVAMHGLFRVTVQSNNAGDNGVAVSYDFLMEQCG